MTSLARRLQKINLDDIAIYSVRVIPDKPISLGVLEFDGEMRSLADRLGSGNDFAGTGTKGLGTKEHPIYWVHFNNLSSAHDFQLKVNSNDSIGYQAMFPSKSR